VTKNDSFLAFTKAVAEGIVKNNPADVAAVGAMPLTLDGFGPTVEDVRKGLIGKIGENMSVPPLQAFRGGKLASYLHGTRIGVVVEFDGDEAAAKDVAMHVAAMKPVSLSSADVPADLVAKERSVAAAKAAEDAAKAARPKASPCSPPEIVAKRIEGGVQKYLKEVSLHNQAFVKNDKQTVEQMLKEKAHRGEVLHAVRRRRRHREEG
jgi:elongation factor Ts